MPAARDRGTHEANSRLYGDLYRLLDEHSAKQVLDILAKCLGEIGRKDPREQRVAAAIRRAARICPP